MTPTPSPEKTVEWLYLSTLSRRPTNEEQAEAQRYLKKAGEFVERLYRCFVDACES